MSEENLIELVKEDWVAAMKLVWEEPVWKQQRENCEKYARELAAEEKKQEQEAARVTKAAERLRSSRGRMARKGKSKQRGKEKGSDRKQ